MFGEDYSESPRLPSPWRSLGRSSLDSPSPLSLRTPASTPGTPTESQPAPPALARSRHSLDDDGLNGHFSLDIDPPGFEGLSLDDDEELISGGLHPEVDKSGHIEYKLKLPTPSPVRLAKLQTQLKWRLVEGGGMALYELGVLDNGKLVGLVKKEMKESLNTLGRMLCGLGGGEVRVGRVVRLGGDRRGSTASVEEGEGREDGQPIFESFTVDAEEPTLDYDPGPPVPLVGAVTPLTLAKELSPSKKPFVERSPAERAALKRSKRDAKRGGGDGKNGDGGSGTPSPTDSSNDTSRTNSPSTYRSPTFSERRLHEPRTPSSPVDLKPSHRKERSPKAGSPKPAAAAKPKLSQSAPDPVCRKPTLVNDGQVRYVVEAIVLKKGGLRRRQKPEGDGLFGEDEDDEDGSSEGEGEGWRYLEFDWMRAEKARVIAGI